jgi:hypothetical protein
MGLTLAFRQKYGDEALEITKTFTKQLGARIGNQIKEKTGAGSSLEDIESVLHAWQDPAALGPPVKSVIEGKKLTMTREKPNRVSSSPRCKTVERASGNGLQHSSVSNV